jgi:hypothetical protein
LHDKQPAPAVTLTEKIMIPFSASCANEPRFVIGLNRHASTCDCEGKEVK